MDKDRLMTLLLFAINLINYETQFNSDTKFREYIQTELNLSNVEADELEL